MQGVGIITVSYRVRLQLDETGPCLKSGDSTPLYLQRRPGFSLRAVRVPFALYGEVLRKISKYRDCTLS